ncbi:MAG: RNA 2',3'-cyclic phosphodiesterase [Anaerolineales bacterium]|nr:RNA 2',3'-cyclic phosphodiesterase [Anaerolineales bacterium]
MSMLRAFIAAELPETTRAEVWNQTARLRQNLGAEAVRWVSAENLHLTLKFIGDIPSAHLDFLKQALTRVANAAQPFDLRLTHLGSFPTSKLPRVLWAGVHAPATLTALSQALETALVKLGYKAEIRAFAPHLTIGRIKPTASQTETVQVRDFLQSFQLGAIGAARVNSICLFQSDLRPTGSVYTKLFSADFKNPI